VALALCFASPLFALEITPVTPAEYEAKVVRPHRGRVLLVNFWATWCEPCREEMPALLSAATKMKSKGADVVLVSADDLKLRDTRVRKFLQRLRVDVACFIETSEDPQTFIDRVDPKWGGELPRSALYDREGRLVRSVSTAQTQEQFEMLLSLDPAALK
jgi:thiol-disulfide isomerase/thioredoxin